MIDLPPQPGRSRALAAYAGAVLASLVILACVFELWRADINTPFDYEWDAVFCLTLTKGMMENGWYLTIPSVGAPEGLDMHDYPLADSLHFLGLKLIASVVQNYVAAYNIYFLLGFPLTTVTMLFVLRRFNVSYLPAIVASLLYAYQPYHYFRGLKHLFLSTYCLVPCLAMVALWIYLDRFPRFSGVRQAAEPERKSRIHRLAGSILICFLQASAGVYYAFFACFLFIVAGVSAALHRRRFDPLYTAGLLIGVTTLGVLANVGSHIAFDRIHGRNKEVARRSPIDAEVLGMKITDLMLPTPGHRVDFMAQKRQAYDSSSVSSNENAYAALGVVGAIGFCVLIALLFARQSGAEDTALMHGLSQLNLFAVLLATMGGFGVIFNRLVTPQIRCYNRFSIFIAFFSLFAVAILLQRFGERFATSKGRRVLLAFLMVALLSLGLLDQTPRNAAGDYAGLQKRWKSDGDLVTRIEAILPPQSMIYQMPFVPFPEWPVVHRMYDYDHFRGYLHSRQLRWSYGAMRGRPPASRDRELSEKPVEEQLPELVRLGFAGIWVDRFGYEDNGANVEQRLAELLQIEPVVSSDARIAFFDMTGYSNRPGGERLGEAGIANDRRETPR